MISPNWLLGGGSRCNAGGGDVGFARAYFYDNVIVVGGNEYYSSQKENTTAARSLSTGDPRDEKKCTNHILMQKC